MSESVLKVRMFGGFSVSYGDEAVVPIDARNSKMVQLLQYLLVHRNKMVRQMELIDILLGDEDCSNPTGTLKNIVYRLRKLLIAAGMPKDVIIYKKSAYGFCADIPCEMDTEQFAALMEKVEGGTLEDEEQIETALEAARIYKGDFLQKASGEPWVLTKAVFYQELYVNALMYAYDVAGRTDAYKRIYDALNEAAHMYPYEEDLYLMHISCLYKLGRVKEALAKYESVVTLLYNDLGIGPTERLQELYKDITNGVHVAAESVIDVRTKLSEQQGARGPYFTNVETFSGIFQFIVRHMQRTGESVFLMLVTPTEMDGTPPKQGSRMSKVAAAMQEAVRLTCRSGDVFTRYSATQFLLMLMELKQESCDIVAERLRHCFYRMPRMGRIQLKFRCVSAADMDSIMLGEDIRNYPLDWSLDMMNTKAEVVVEQ